MDLSGDRNVFAMRCLRAAAAAAAAGATLSKSADGPPTLEIERAGRSVGIPIVTDDRTWSETTVEEALYAVLVDARGFAGAHVDAVTLATLEPGDEADVPAITRDLGAERARVALLADVLGGEEALEALYTAAGV